MLLMSQTINSLEIARDRLIFLLSSLSFVINLQKYVLVLLQNIVSRSGNRLGENDINTTAGKSKKIEIEMLKAYFKSQNDIMGSDQPFRFCLLNSTGSATSYAKIRFLHQQQIAVIRNNPSYQSAMYLKQDSIQELQWWFNNIEICNGKLIVSPTSKAVIQLHASKKFGVLSESVHRASVVSPGVKPPYQFSGIN